MTSFNQKWILFLFSLFFYSKNLGTSCYSFIMTENDIQASQKKSIYIFLFLKAISSPSHTFEQIHKTNDSNLRSSFSSSSKNILRNKSWALSQPGFVMWASASRTYFAFIDSLSTSYLVLCSFPSAVRYSRPPPPLHQLTFMMWCTTCSLTPLMFRVCPQLPSSSSSWCLGHASLRGRRKRDKYFFQLCHIEASWMTSCSWEWRGFGLQPPCQCSCHPLRQSGAKSFVFMM